MKQCSQCHQALPHADFSKRSRSSDGYASYCKACQKKQNKLSYQRVKTTGAQTRQALEGQSLAEKYPLLTQQWDTQKNTLDPMHISARNSTKVHWKCSTCSHEWESSPNSITRKGDGTHCPRCDGTLRESVLVTHPTVKEWVQDSSLVEALTKGSKKNVEFTCPAKGHVFTLRMRNFNHECPICAVEAKSVAVMAPHLIKEWGKHNSITPDQVSYASAQTVHWECEQGHAWSTVAYQRTLSNTICPTCSSSLTSSQQERELQAFIEGLNVGDVVLHDRTVLDKKELDILIPSQNIAIEFNGVYWHSEATGKNKHYHHDKWKACDGAGVQLLQIWSDDYSRNPEAVKSMIAHKLGASSQKRVYARSTHISELSQSASDAFLDAYHIQGAVRGSIRLGLISGEGTVAVIVFKFEPGTDKKTLNLLRFATSSTVVGGFTKLLQGALTLHPDVEEVVTFSDHCVSDGGLYLNNGFVVESVIPPDYSYVVKGQREHKFNYRVKRFQQDNALLFEPGLTESQLAELNGLPRVWDAGKTKWKFSRK